MSGEREPRRIQIKKAISGISSAMKAANEIWYASSAVESRQNLSKRAERERDAELNPRN